MKKRLNLYLCSLLIAIALMITSQNIKADDACVWHSTLNNQDDANAICPGVCAQTFLISQWNGQWNIPQYAPAKCTSWWWGKVSVCGCEPIPCQCKRGSQILCDESVNKPGPNQCSSNCDCTQGRRCNDSGWCQGTPGLPCCAECRPQYQTCMTLCNNVPIQERADCESECGGDLNTCTNGCQPCSAVRKGTKDSPTKGSSGGGIPSVPTTSPKTKKALPLTPTVPSKEKVEPKKAPPESPKEKEEPKETPSEVPKEREETKDTPFKLPEEREEPKETPSEAPKEKEESKGRF